MLLDGLKLDFTGFRPSLSISNQVRNVAYDVFMKAPSDSFTRATIRRIVNGTEEVFVGILKVTSSVGTFLAQEQDTDVVRMIERLHERMGHQLIHWKSGRFSDGTT